MVKNNIVIADPSGKGINIEPVFEAYEKISAFHRLPRLTEIFTEYNATLETRMSALQVAMYSDDFYDGHPDSRPREMLPDFVAGDLQERIGMNELEFDELVEVLERFCMFYIYGKEVKHAPNVEVW